MKVEGELISIVLDNQNFPEVHFSPFFFADPSVTGLKVDCRVVFGCCVLCIVALSIGAEESGQNRKLAGEFANICK